MGLDRIRRLVGNSLVVLAVSAAAAPAFAQTPYDGLWNVTVVTKSGSCEPSARFPRMFSRRLTLQDEAFSSMKPAVARGRPPPFQ